MAAGVLLVAACGAKQAVGPAFCQSYEDNYLTACQAHCEAKHDETDRDAPQTCRRQCVVDLRDDDTFGADCAAELEQLK